LGVTLWVYIDFKPRCLVADGARWGAIYTMSRPLPDAVLEQAEMVLVDQGFSAARRGVADGELWRWYIRAVVRAQVKAPGVPVIAVVPDVFGSMERTLRRWEWWARRLQQIGAIPALVLQEPHRVDEWEKTQAYRDAEVVAIPAHYLPDGRKCAHAAEECALAVRRVARRAYGDGKWPHLLGPKKRTLKLLLDMLGREVKSFDGMAYRMASSDRVRIRSAPGERGRWMVAPGLEEDYLEAWLAGLLPVRRVC